MENTDIILTGIRPTNNLTIANYIGAIKPIVDFQNQGLRPFVFIADIHALTDNEPDVLKYGDEILFDLLAAGVDPQKSIVYKQSSIFSEVAILNTLLLLQVSVAELMRLPTLKEKMKSNNIETANSLLLTYPVLMTADILIQRATIVPVGKDQKPHIEIAQKITQRFNAKMGNIFPELNTHIVEGVKILSLRGNEKMSKSLPNDALFLTDDEKTVDKKIRRAQTAEAGQMSESLTSHILLIKSICDDQQLVLRLDEIVDQHMAGENVMGEFKMLFTAAVNKFTQDFQIRRSEILNRRSVNVGLLHMSSQQAVSRAKETIGLVANSYGVTF